MIIFTNPGNPLGLKVHILAKLANCNAITEKVNLNDSKFKANNLLILPTVDLNNIRLFSTNAVAKYLFPGEGQLRDEWLEWSSSALAPALIQQAMNTVHDINSKADTGVSTALKKLENHLTHSAYVAGENLTAADIAIWSILVPKFQQNNLSGAITNVFKWFKKIAALPIIKQIIETESLNEFNYSSLLAANSYAATLYVPLKVSHDSLESEIKASLNETQCEVLSEEEVNDAREHFIHSPEVERKETRTVLPKVGERNILITSALPYVNNVPHLGNIIGCVLSADIFARYCRTAGYNTLYICGTDEYGTATENKALAEKLTPREICDKYFELHNSIYRWFGIGFDYFGRTTTQEQTDIVQEAFQDVYKNGYILTESVEQLLCLKCDRFLADRFVEGTCPHNDCGYEDARGDQCDKCGKLVNATELIKPRCKVCNTTPVIRSSEQMFIDLPKIEHKLKDWVNTVESGWTHNAKVITHSWLHEGLKPRCITRDLKWGIPVPHKNFEQKVFYVWFDAPFGYISMTKRYTKEYKQWWQPSNDVHVELFQFMAKDNVPFHTVMWPSALMAINKGYVLASHIMATEYLNYEDGKFSKSRGVGVFGNDAQDTGISADVWRFYLASARPEGQDSSFSWNDLAARNNFELLNNLGNFVNRALVFCAKNYNGIIPSLVIENDDLTLLVLINREIRGYMNSLEKAKLRDGIKHILAISRYGNAYMQTHKPWVLYKGNEGEKIRAGTVIAMCCNISCMLANLLFPYMPTTSRSLFQQLNTKQFHWNVAKPYMTVLLPEGHKIGQPSPIFTKLENEFIKEMKMKYSGSQCNNNTDKMNSLQCDNLAITTTTTISDLEIAIQKQGDKVRQLKSTTKDKNVWQPEVNVLLDLKKRLKELIVKEQQEPSPHQASDNNTEDLKTNINTNTERIKNLEIKIAEQAHKVRNLKSTADASVWKPEVDILLTLKKELAELTGISTMPIKSSTKNKKKK